MPQKEGPRMVFMPTHCLPPFLPPLSRVHDSFSGPTELQAHLHYCTYLPQDNASHPRAVCDTHYHKNLRSHISAKINNICDKDFELVSWQMSVRGVTVHWYNYVCSAVHFKHRWQPVAPNWHFCHRQKSCDLLEHMYCHLEEYKSNFLHAKKSRSWKTETSWTMASTDRMSFGTCLPFWSHHDNCMSWGTFPATGCCSGRNSHGTFSPLTAVHEWSLQLQSGLLPEKEPILQ
jgi:hypothetical protein